MTKVKKTDKAVKGLLAILRDHYLARHPKAQIDAYRYNSASIRVRVIDPDLKGTLLTKRDAEIW